MYAGFALGLAKGVRMIFDAKKLFFEYSRGRVTTLHDGRWIGVRA